MQKIKYDKVRQLDKIVFLALGLILVALVIQMAILNWINNRNISKMSEVLLDCVVNVIEKNEQDEKDMIASLKEDYIVRAKAVAYIINANPEAEKDVDELKKIAKLMAVDEIHLLDATGKIYSGTIPEYYGYSFDSGEQMEYFKPMLEDKTLTMCQDVTPNTSEGKKIMYAITWEDTGMEFNAKGASANGSLKALFMIRDGNNNENMKGTVSDADLSSITIKIPDTKVNELSLANKGRIMVNNKFYYYDGWTAKVGENGVNSVTFKLAPESQMADQAEVDRVKGDGQSNYLTTGSSMDAMGIPYYQNQINEFLRNFTQAFNDIEKQGVTLDGDKMGAFFVGTSPTGNTFDADSWDAKVQAAKKDGWTTDIELSSDGDSYYQFTATTLAVNSKSLKDSNYFATSTKIT